MKPVIPILAGLLVASAAPAQPPASAELKPALQGLGFLVGHWSTPTRGKMAGGGSSTGEISFTVEAGGAALLRKEHDSFYDAAGKATGTTDVVMMIYPQAGTLHADYVDGDHVAHYSSTNVDPGRAVTFTTASIAAAPTFRLTYTLTAPGVVDIAFAMAPPGSSDFHPIATGSATRDR